MKRYLDLSRAGLCSWCRRCARVAEEIGSGGSRGCGRRVPRASCVLALPTAVWPDGFLSQRCLYPLRVRAVWRAGWVRRVLRVSCETVAVALRNGGSLDRTPCLRSGSHERVVQWIAGYETLALMNTWFDGSQAGDLPRGRLALSLSASLLSPPLSHSLLSPHSILLF